MIVTVPTIKRTTESVWLDSDKKYFDSQENFNKQEVTEYNTPEEFQEIHPTGEGFALAIKKSDDVNYFKHKIKVNKEYGKMNLEIDTSFKANVKFDKYFAETLNCSLNEYVERIQRYTKKDNTAKAHFLSLLKFLYCYVNSEKLPTFDDFTGMFDIELADQIISIIGTVLKEVGTTISKN